jgi:hypothetical protein
VVVQSFWANRDEGDESEAFRYWIEKDARKIIQFSWKYSNKLACTLRTFSRIKNGTFKLESQEVGLLIVHAWANSANKTLGDSK